MRLGVDGPRVQVAVLRREGGADGAAGTWLHLRPVAGHNDAKAGERLQVRLRCDHRLPFGSLFAGVFGASNDGRLPLEASAESVRR